MSHLKNFAVSASRGSMAVFIFGVVVALVGAMMLFAPAGFAQEATEADEAPVVYDDEYDSDALAEETQSVESTVDDESALDEETSESVEEPEVPKDPVSVERDGDIDTVTVDDRDFGAWHDDSTGLEKVSDDGLYGISRESDAGIDEIVEVEADGYVVDEDAYGFIHDDGADLDKIVIDYYGLKTTPPETLSLKIKSSKKGEYSILDEDDIPAKADVQDAGFLSDPSAEEQEKIDKANKENRAADTQTGTRRLDTDAPTVESGNTNYPILKSAIGGEYTQTTMFVNKIVVRDKRGSLTQGLAENGGIILKKQKHTCRLTSTNVEVLEETGGKASLIAIDTSGCNTGANDRKLDIWEGQSTKDVISVQLRASSNSSADDFDVYLFASADANEKAGDVQIPGGIPEPDEWTEKVDSGTLTTKTEALGTRGDFKVTMTREFEKGGDIAGDVSAMVDHVNGAIVDDNVFAPKLKVVGADGKTVKEVEGNLGDSAELIEDANRNAKGGVSFTGLEGVTVSNGGKIVVEMGFRRTSGTPVKDDLNMQPLGVGELNVELESSDEHFELKTVGNIDAVARVASRENPFEDIIKIAYRSKFEGAEVKVEARGNILRPWKASNYSFDILSDDEGKTGIQDGYGLKVDVKSIDGDQVTYEVYPVKDGKQVNSALIEAGTQIAVKSAFSGQPSSVTTTVKLEGEKVAKAADKNWAYGLGEIKKYPVGGESSRTITGKWGELQEYGFAGATAPFMLEEPGKPGQYTYGGVCLQPFLGVPGLMNATTNPEDWNQYPVDYSPAGGEIPVQNQKALSYLVNQLYFEGVTESQAVGLTEQKMMEIASQSGLEGLDRKHAFAAVYSAILTLAGWDYDSLQEAFEELSPAVYEGRKTSMERGRVVADWILNNVDLDDVAIDYQILQPKGLESASNMPWQTIIVPGGGGSSALSTIASLEEGNFSDYRLSKAALNEVSTVHDRVEFRGLKSGKYVLKTELRRLLDEASDEMSVVYSGERELYVSGESAAFEDVSLALADLNADLEPGRYVFFETIVDSAGNEVVKHTDADDMAQSFWLEEPTEEVPSSAGFQLKKVAADDKHLVSGAEFTVADGANLSKASFVKKMDSLGAANENGANYVVDGLETGKDYWVFETKAPSGEDGKNYQLLTEPLRFKLTEDGLMFWDKTIAPSGDYTSGQTFPVVEKSKVEGDNGSVIGVATVANVWIGDLPKTGGNGIAPWLLLGGLIMAAGALMGNRRRA